MIDEIKKMKKVLLHFHLDGSIPLKTAMELAEINNIEETQAKMVARNQCEDLNDYLTKFDLPISLMQTKENLIRIAKETASNLLNQNIIYAEIRFAPNFHTKGGLTLEEVVEAVISGIKETPDIKINLLLCLMRGNTEEENIKTIELARKYLNKGVCGVDLAGPEALYSNDKFTKLFKMVKEKHIPFTIHAGEADRPNSVKTAIEMGATRIGHGIKAIEDEQVIELIKEKDILLEVCPTSNVQTNAVAAYEDHPIYELYNLGIKICINTDNDTVSNVNLNDEYIKLNHIFGFTTEDFKIMNLNAIEKAFISEEEKKELKRKIQN